MDELTTSTLLIVIATALLSVALSTHAFSAETRELRELHDAVTHADHQARLMADEGEKWAWLHHSR